MNTNIKKIRLIFIPFIILAVCIIGGYSFLNWLLFIKLHVFSLKDDIINFWVPFILPWIPVLIWLRPRIKLLNLKRKKGDLPFLYIFIASIAIAIPTIIVQAYLETAMGKLTQLDNIYQIEKHEATKYYTLKNYFIDKSHIGVQNSFEVSGRSNEYFNMSLYMVMPIFASPNDTLTSNCIAWYGVKYSKQISNRLDEKAKETRYENFVTQSQSDFNNKDVNEFVYFDRIGNTDDHKEYIAAIKNNKAFSANTTTVLIPINEPFESRNGDKLMWIFRILAIGTIIWLVMVTSPNFDEVALEKFNNGAVEKSTHTKDIFNFFLPHKGFLITPIIMYVNIIIFIVMVFAGLGVVSFKAIDLLAWGANYRPLTTNGEWWRLLTNMFLHGGLIHLVSNMCGLLFVGIFLEPRLGAIKYIVVYLITGIVASLTSLWWHDATVSIGASGAIFGLYGVFLALLITKVFPQEYTKAFLLSTLIFVGYNLLMGLTGGIDNAAHIGGLISGFVIGLILYPQLKRDNASEELIHGQTQNIEESKTE